MRVYVSGGSTEVGRAERFIARCIEAGHEITHDWTASVRAYQRGEEVDASRAAQEDLRGVIDADKVVALIPREPSRGVWYELGIADASFVRCVLVGPPGCADIWTHRHELVADEDAALAALDHVALLREERDRLRALESYMRHAFGPNWGKAPDDAEAPTE